MTKKNTETTTSVEAERSNPYRKLPAIPLTEVRGYMDSWYVKEVMDTLRDHRVELVHVASRGYLVLAEHYDAVEKDGVLCPLPDSTKAVTGLSGSRIRDQHDAVELAIQMIWDLIGEYLIDQGLVADPSDIERGASQAVVTYDVANNTIDVMDVLVANARTGENARAPNLRFI